MKRPINKREEDHFGGMVLGQLEDHSFFREKKIKEKFPGSTLSLEAAAATLLRRGSKGGRTESSLKFQGATSLCNR